MAINIYYERDPSVDPGTGSTGCTNPPSVTMIKCVFWGGPVNSDNAVNTGQYRNQFQVVITGSNGYVNNTLVSPPGYGTANYLGNAAINAPLDSYGYNTYLGSAIFNNGPFNASLCAEACSTKSAYALAHPPTDGSPVQTCQFFNTYILYINNTNNLQGQYCAMYSESWSSSYATNVGQYRGNDHFLIEYSYTFSNSTNPGSANKNGAVHQASQAISYSSLQTYCSTLLGYTTPVTTVQATTTGATVTVTNTVTNSYTTTLQKRDDAVVTTVPLAALMHIPTSGSSDIATSSVTVITISSDSSNNKRGLSTPAGLTQYPGDVITSACSLEASPVTTTSTATNFVTATATVTATSTVSVAVATASPPCSLSQYTCPLDLSNFQIITTNSGRSDVDCHPLTGEIEYPGYFVGWLPYGEYPLTFSFDNSTNYIETHDKNGRALPITFDNDGNPSPINTVYTPTQCSAIVCSIAGNGQISCSSRCNGITYSQFSLFQLYTWDTRYLGLQTSGGSGTPLTLYAVTTSC